MLCAISGWWLRISDDTRSVMLKYFCVAQVPASLW